jgi:hypothetical protein
MASASPWPPAHGADGAPGGGGARMRQRLGRDGSWGPGGTARGGSPVGWQGLAAVAGSLERCGKGRER